MRRALLAALLLAACRTTPEAPEIQRIRGTLTVHLGPGEKDTRVVLGEGAGAKGPAAPDAKGDVVFTGVDGPQDVTIVIPAENQPFLVTLASVDVAEVRCDVETLLGRGPPDASAPITGRVTNFIGPNVSAAVYGAGLDTGGFFAANEGIFAGVMHGRPLPATATFVGVETERPFGSQVLRIGAVGPLPFPPPGPVEVPLTATLTEAVTVDVLGLDPWGGRAELRTSLEPHENEALPLRAADTGPHATVLFPPRTGAMSSWPRYVDVATANAAGDEGRARVQVTENHVELRVPRAIRLLAPTEPRLALDTPVRWEPDARTTLQGLVLSKTRGENLFLWVVFLPGNRREFRFFSPPGLPAPEGDVTLDVDAGHATASWDVLVHDGIVPRFDRAFDAHAALHRPLLITRSVSAP